ncbi:hypothetical protein [Bacillus sp. JCM 19041]|uniref:tubby C-terminal domain-like protein n=1 Tax=Bacillus sp. JCM 19041 TaxID=1460637 RepID=UPI000AB08BAE
MSKLLLLFSAGFIGFTLRFIFIGEFELNQLLLLLSFPLAAILIYFIMKWQFNKDRNYHPDGQTHGFTSRFGDRVSSSIKQIYYGQTYLGSYRREYTNRWKRIVADMMKNPGIWYLNLSFSLTNGDQITFQLKDEKNKRSDYEWIIHKNGEQVGFVQTNQAIKSKSNMKPFMRLTYRGSIYDYDAPIVGARTEIHYQDEIIAVGDRIKVSILGLKVSKNVEHDALVLFMGYLLFVCYFGK